MLVRSRRGVEGATPQPRCRRPFTRQQRGCLASPSRADTIAQRERSVHSNVNPARTTGQRRGNIEHMPYIQGQRAVRLLCARCDNGLAVVHVDDEGNVVLTDWQHRVLLLNEPEDHVVIVDCRNAEHGQREIEAQRLVKATRRAVERNRAILLRA